MHDAGCDIGGDHDGPCVSPDGREGEWGPPEPDPNEPPLSVDVDSPDFRAGYKRGEFIGRALGPIWPPPTEMNVHVCGEDGDPWPCDDQEPLRTPDAEYADAMVPASAGRRQPRTGARMALTKALNDGEVGARRFHEHDAALVLGALELNGWTLAALPAPASPEGEP